MADSIETRIVCPKCQEASAVITSEHDEQLLRLRCDACGLAWTSFNPLLMRLKLRPEEEQGDSVE
jgi:ribosomal protein S27AE